MSQLYLVLIFIAGFLLLNAAFRFIRRMTPGKNRIKADIVKLREELKPYLGRLVPWNKEEIELLSFDESQKTVKKGAHRTVKGVYNSIYHEPMLAYALRIYRNKEMMLYARTANHEYVYRMKPGGVEVVADGRPIGKISEGHVLTDKKNKALASSKSGATDPTIPLKIGGVEVAQLVNPKLIDRPNRRAFELISDELSDDQIPLLQALTILELVKVSNDIETIPGKVRNKSSKES
jgi:hypothetical protein